ncbi:MAG TPA: hypothetical protein VMS56_06705 [Thermoanaerobaculia bacterium]|nr:hypothetical protein [Thermoanaerobaculia bacterium]
MTARGEEFAQKIEQTIREAVERMVSDMRSSIEDVREAVVQQLDAASQSVQADAKSLSLRGQLETILSGMDEQTAPPPAAAVESGTLRRAIRAIEGGKSQVEVLNALLEQVGSFSSRAALFILKGETFAGWKGSGFSARGGNDESVKRFSADGSDVPDLGTLLREEHVVASDGRTIAAKLGAPRPERALLVPMVIKDKVAAAIYADQTEGEDGKLDRAAIELLVFTTGLLIDTLAIRKKIPSPTLSAGEGEPEATILTAPSASVPRPTPPPPPVPRPSPPATPPASRSFELESEDIPPRAASSRFATTSIPSPVASPPPPPPPPPRTSHLESEPVSSPPPQAPKAPPALRPEPERPSTQYVPPAGVAGGGRFSQQPQTAEGKKHDEAKRFARLLVSEIKLYNEAKVDDGRKHRDLYERMKDDVDKSRQMYEERIPEEVRRQSNYFYDELVRILADGDPDLLGL